MNLEKMFEAQKKLHDHIGYKGEDKFEKDIAALIVEIGECMNEWRGFKYWSKDQEPRTFIIDGLHDGINEPVKNPLLEEYVDGLSFVFELGINKKYTFFKDFVNNAGSENIVHMYLDIFQLILDFDLKPEFYVYELLLGRYLELGKLLGFTDEQIEQAYYEKNRVNHERQNNGY